MLQQRSDALLMKRSAACWRYLLSRQRQQETLLQFPELALTVDFCLRGRSTSQLPGSQTRSVQRLLTRLKSTNNGCVLFLPLSIDVSNDAISRQERSQPMQRGQTMGNCERKDLLTSLVP